MKQNLYQDVKAEEFVADVVRVHVGAVHLVDGMLRTDDCFDDLQKFSNNENKFS